MISEIGFFVPALRGGQAFVPNPPELVKNIETLMSDLAACSAVLARLDTLIIRFYWLHILIYKNTNNSAAFVLYNQNLATSKNTLNLWRNL